MKYSMHEMRHSYFGKRVEHHRGRMIIAALILMQLIIWGFFHFHKLLPVTPNTIRTDGDYLTLSEKNDERGALATLKRGSITEASNKFDKAGNTLPDRALPLKKVFFLLKKNEYQSAEQILSTLTHSDATVRSLYLQLRAHLLCAQKKQTECEVLATDANILDPLAPGALLMVGIAQSMKRERLKAASAFQRAETLGAVCDDPVCLYYRGITAFYRANYTGAIADLGAVQGDPFRENDAALFLGRTYYNERIRTQAHQRFDTVITRKEGVDRTASLRKARILREQEQFTGAMDQYMQIYSGDMYGFEVLTDMIVLAYEQNDIQRVEDLLATASQKIDTSVYSHLLMVRTLRAISRLDLVDQYINAGLLLSETIENPEQKILSEKDFITERLHVSVMRWYTHLQQGTSLDAAFSKIQNNEIDQQLPQFLQLLTQIVQKQPITTIVPGIPPTSGEYQLIAGRYALLTNNPRETLQIMVDAGHLTQGSEDERIIRTKRAVVKRLQNTALIAGFEKMLGDRGYLPKGFTTFTEKQKRTYVLGRFDPWMKRMQPYLVPGVAGLIDKI